MSVDDISNEETAKITGILEAKWTQMAADNSRLKAECQSLNTALDIMTQDRNYWRDRAEAGEVERDDERDQSEFMLRQWQGVYAIAEETKARVKEKRLQAAITSAEQRHIAVVTGFAPPHIRNGN